MPWWQEKQLKQEVALLHCTGDTEGGAELLLYPCLTSVSNGKWVVNPTPWLIYAQERGTVFTVHEVGWISGSVWTGEENLATTGFQNPNQKPVAGRITDWAIPHANLNKKEAVKHQYATEYLLCVPTSVCVRMCV